MPSSETPVRRISTCTVKAAAVTPPRCDLTTWDLAMLSVHYIQTGHLFSIPLSSPPDLVPTILDRLKRSLSASLVHFYPLSGRLVTEKAPPTSQGSITYISCHGQGAEFTHAVADGVAVRDILEATEDVPAYVRSFFPLDGAVNHDGHTLPLLSVQVTELVDGIFIGCSFNHAVGDGSSFWNFFGAWAEICRESAGKAEDIITISRPPVLDRCFLDGARPPIVLPYDSPDEFIDRFSPPPLRERIFHFTSESIKMLKTRANEEARTDRISSFQALSALVWRCITRARRLPDSQETTGRLAFDNRSRLRPPLPPNYFGNSIYAVGSPTTAGELLSRDLGWAALLLNGVVASNDDSAIRAAGEKWMAKPMVYSLRFFDEHSIHMGSSPRFDMYGCDFGWGRAAALRSGSANKFDGKVSSYPGREGGGSVDLEICLLPENMKALESDEEFMTAVVSQGPSNK